MTNIYNDYEIHDYLKEEMVDGYDPTIEKWLNINNLEELFSKWFEELERRFFFYSVIPKYF